ncbi:MAG TPA: prolipoprotein diacylglyceryl transferase [Candidatus Xenobia bacterium]
MHRVLLFPGTPYTIYTYGAILSLGIVLSTLVFLPRARRIGLDEDQSTELIGWFIVAIVAGARLMHVMLEWPEYLHHPLQIFNLREGGLALYGGIAGGTITLLAWSRRRGIKLVDLLDAAAPSCILAQGIGRIGCFFNGCCAGKFCPPPWGLWFRDAEPDVARIPRYPTQLYELGADLVIFGFLLWYTRRRHYRGEVFGWYLTLYAMVRFVLEFWRDEPVVLMGLTFAQWCGVVFSLLGLAGLAVLRRHGTTTEGLSASPPIDGPPALVAENS